MTNETYSFHDLIARTITGKYNQDFRMMTVGSTGSGKSSANLALAEDAAKAVAEILGTNPKEHFNIEENVAIIETEAVLSLFENIKPWTINILDDIGIAWSARDFMKELNKLMNDIFQTFRTENTAILMTIPHNFLIDKVPRSLCHYFMEPDRSVFSAGMTIWKPFKLTPKYRKGLLYYPYPKIQENGRVKRIVRYYAHLPSQSILDAYEPKRAMIARKIRMEKIEGYRTKTEAKEGNGKKLDTKEGLVDMVDRFRDIVNVEDACKRVGISQTHYYRLKKNIDSSTSLPSVTP